MQAQPPVKVFVSSTFVDLKTHRAQVIQALRKAGFVVDPMEDWTADADEPKAFSQQRVDGCDLCLLLVAFRRGCVPAGESLSITQLEYQYALDHGIAVLPFLLQDDAPWPRRFDEMDKDPAIRDWRAALRQRHGCGEFGLDPASLDVLPAVTRWLKGRPQSAPAAPSPMQAFDFTAYLAEKRRDFTGREWLFAEVERWRTGRPEKALLIVGDPGIGKSAIVAELVRRNPGGQVLAHHCCRADIPDTLHPGNVVRSLVAQLVARLPEFAARVPAEALSEGTCTKDPRSAFYKGVLTPLASLPAPSGGPLYLLLDALDEALSGRETGLSLVDVLAACLDDLPGWLRVVATTRGERQVLDRLRGLRAWELNARDPRNLDDLDRYVRLRLHEGELAERLRASGRSADQVAEVLRRKSEGNFLYVRQALDGVACEAFRVDQLESLPPGLAGLYLKFFERHFPTEAAYAPVKKVLQVVAAAQGPLTAAQLVQATGLDGEEELPGLLHRLSAYLPGRGEPGTEKDYALFHKSLADWLTDAEQCGTRYYASPRRGHERLAEACLTDYRRGPLPLSAYALRHLPRHLAGSTRWDDLAALLRDWRFLEGKAEAGLVFDLAGDFTRAVRRLPPKYAHRGFLALVEEALRTDLHFLARHPMCLFQCLWNRCWWYDSPEAGKHYIPSPAGTAKEPAPWEAGGAPLATWMESWRAARERAQPGCCWLRSLRPPPVHLGTAQRAVFRGHENGVSSVAFAPDGRRVVSGSQDGTLRLWDGESGAELRCLRGHAARVTSVAFALDGRRLVSGSWDRTVRVWDAESGAELRCLCGHESGVAAVAFAPDGSRVVSASDDRTVRLWDAVSGAELRCLRGHQREVSSVAFAPDGGRVASGADDRTVRLWDAETGAELRCLRGHAARVTSVAFAPDGRRLASGSWDQTVRVWDAETGRELHSLRGHEAWVRSVAFAPDGRLASGSDDRTVRLWDAGTGTELRCLRGHEGWVSSVSFAPDGCRLVSGSHDGTVRVWDAGTGTELRCLRGHEDWVSSVSFAPDGRRLVSGSHDRTVRLWDAETGAELRCLRGHADWVRSVSFAPDNRRLVSGSHDGTVREWDAATGHCLEVMPGDKLPAGVSPASTAAWRAIRHPLEISIEETGGRAVAWFPIELDGLVSLSGGRTWAGYVSDYVGLFTLEGARGEARAAARPNASDA